MTRKIKFREWNHGKYRSWEELGAFHMRVLNDGKGLFEQYTGLTTVDGTELYEGDLIQVKGNIWVVEWFDTAFWAIPVKGFGSSQPLSQLYEYGKSVYIEVLGNVNEHTELLEKEV